MPLTKIAAADVMREDPTTIDVGALARVALGAILASPHQCVVVLDEEGRPVGIATDGDIIRRLLAEEAPGGSHLRWLLASTDHVLQYIRDSDRARGGRVEDLMSSPPVSVAPDESLQRVAELFLEHDIDQVPVVRDGTLVGLVRRHDLVDLIVRQHDEAEGALDAGRD